MPCPCNGTVDYELFYYQIATVDFFRCFINCKPKISPSIKLSVQSRCQGLQCSKISSHEWILYQETKRNSSTVWSRKQNLHLIASTLLNLSDIVIQGGSLPGGNKYRLVLFVVTTQGLPGMSAYDFSTGLPPSEGKCSISPTNGTSLKTYFYLNCSSWKSESTPLSYQFQYRLENGLYNVLYRGVNSTVVTSWIPPGNNADNYNLKVICTVTDSFGISASPISLTVKVS